MLQINKIHQTNNFKPKAQIANESQMKNADI